MKSSLSDKFEKLLSHLREQVCVAEIHLGVVRLLVVCKLIVMHVVISWEFGLTWQEPYKITHLEKEGPERDTEMKDQ